MTKPRTPRPYLQPVQRYVRRVRALLDSRGYYPRERAHTDLVLLALFSKSIRVAEAICALVKREFHEEAFGLTRTLLDSLITIRFIANKDTDQRAERFFNFLSVDTIGWIKVIQTHYPGNLLPPMPDLPKVATMAATYTEPHKWAGKGMTARKMALEPSTWEVDDKGKPLTLQFLYEAVFHWSSHFVHPTIAGLESHVVKPGKEQFKVHAQANALRHKFGELALFNVVSMLGQVVVHFFHGMNEAPPERYTRNAEALSRSFTR